MWPLFCSLLFASPSASRPNILFILADDLGWRDLHCYGNPWHDTPHLDRLAAQGTRFTAGYAPAPICSASRVALLTGRSPARLGFEFVVKAPEARPPGNHPLIPPPYPLDLPLSEITLAELLGTAGYATAYFGKWHVAQHHQGYLGWSPTHGPLQQGFAAGAPDFGLHPYGDATRPAADSADLPSDDFGRDALTDRAIAFLRSHDTRRPFFLQLSHYFVHDPVRTRARWLVAKYQKRLPADAAPERAVYAAMVETLDHLVGQLLRALDHLGLAENTLVVFTSDNGGHPRFAANGPLRGSKWNVYEGGLRVPWLVRWPGRVPAGATNDTPFIGTDLFPTLASAAHAKLPAGVTLDGVDVLPLWLGKPPTPSAAPDRALIWHFPYYHPETRFAQALARIGVDDFAVSQTHPQSAIRAGDWTLVHFFASDRDELYQLSRDPSQRHDVSATHPDKARELRRRLDDYLDSVRARRPIAASRG